MMGTDDAIGDSQPQPGPLPRLLGGEEGFENMTQVFVFDTTAGVTDLE
jgi:hypothetical protein